MSCLSATFRRLLRQPTEVPTDSSCDWRTEGVIWVEPTWTPLGQRWACHSHFTNLSMHLMITIMYCPTFILFPSHSHRKEKGRRQNITWFGHWHLPILWLLLIEWGGVVGQLNPKKEQGVSDLQKWHPLVVWFSGVWFSGLWFSLAVWNQTWPSLHYWTDASCKLRHCVWLRMQIIENGCSNLRHGYLQQR